MKQKQQEQLAAVPPSIRKRLIAVRNRVYTMTLLGGFGRILVLLLGLWTLRCVLDLWLQFDWSVRLVFLLIDFALAGFIGYRFLWLPLKRSMDIEGAALLLQKHFPEAGSQLIAALQLAPKAAAGVISENLIQPLLVSAHYLAKSLPWREAAPFSEVRNWVFGASALICLIVGLFLFSPERTMVLANRLFLSTAPPVTRTMLIVEEVPDSLPRGNDLEIRVKTSGVIPSSAFIETESDSGEDREYAMQVEDDEGTFIFVLDNLQDSFQFRIRAGDARSPWQDVEVLTPPNVRNVAWRVVPPAYTGEVPFVPDQAVIRIPQGSVLEIEGDATAPVQSVRLVGYDSSGDGIVFERNLSATGNDFKGSTIQDSLEVRSLAVIPMGENGVEPANPTRVPLEVIEDQPPTIDLDDDIAPEDSVAVYRPIRFAGNMLDDYGLQSARLHWAVFDTSSSQVEAIQTGTIDLIKSDGVQKRNRFSFTLTPSDEAGELAIPASTGHTVEWWFEAVDNMPGDAGPNITSTPKRSLRIVTPEEKAREVMEGIRRGLGELSEVSREVDETGNRISRILEKSQPGGGK